MPILSPPSRRVMKAFTLAEFLVTAVVLCFIAAVLMPTRCGGRENARRASCQSNLKQILLGVKQYTQDYDQKYLLWQQGSDPARGWAFALQPYVKSTQIFQCPSEATSPDPDSSSTSYSDYFYNSNLGPRTGGRSEARLDAPVFTILLGDGLSFSSNSASNGGTVTAPGFDGATSGPAVSQGQLKIVPSGFTEGSRVHLDGANYGFADGHVKWLLPTRLTRDPVGEKPTFRWSATFPPSSGS